MPSLVRQVQPPLKFIPPDYNPWVMRIVHWLLPIFLRFRIRPWLPAGISRIEVENVEHLVNLYAQMEAGKARFLMAVRHVEVDDPLSGLYLCSRAVAKAAKQQGIKLRQPVHTHFLYERGMTLWAGRFVGWLLSRMGGVPIRRGRRPDWVGLKAARSLLSKGSMPMVVAPEGATNGHSERIGPLEPGVAQLGFWCAEDLARATTPPSKPPSVFVLPIGIQYHYEQAHWNKLQNLLSQLEAQSGLKDSGLIGNNSLAPTAEKDAYLRILQLGEHVMTVMETFYDRFYPQPAGENLSAKSTDNESESNAELDCSKRLQQLLNRALQSAESFFHLPGKGTLVNRCRRIEEASWQVIYREDLPDIATLSPLEKGLADWAAEAASLRSLHMRIVEYFVAVDPLYLQEKPSFERCSEIALLISDILGRLDGRKPPTRPRLGRRWVKLTVQPPIAVSPRLASYQRNRKAGRNAVAILSEDIRQALETTIER